MERSDRNFWLLLGLLIAVYLAATFGAMLSAPQIVDSTILTLALLLTWLVWSREHGHKLRQLVFLSFGMISIALSICALLAPGRNIGLLALLTMSAGMAAYISFNFVRRSANHG